MTSKHNYSLKIFKKAKSFCLSLLKKYNSTTMATILVAIVAMSGSLFLFTHQALATSGEQKQIAAVGFGLEKAAKQAEILTEQSLGERTGTIIKIIFNALGVIFLLLMVTAGFFWMTAGGNEEVIRKSKQTIVAAVVGFIVVTISWNAINFFAETAKNKLNAPVDEASYECNLDSCEAAGGTCMGDDECMGATISCLDYTCGGEGMVCCGP